MKFKPVPITLITGYLGSGKTTLINYILNHAKGHKMAVIVNDLGEVNIDAELIAAGGVVSSEDNNLVALQNGCICCTLKEDLIKQLADLVNSHQFDHILIEASGICEPVPIAQTICYMVEEFEKRRLPKFYYLDAIISVTDALRLKNEFGYGEKLYYDEELDNGETIESLVIQQLEFCDIVLLNKASELNEEELNKVKASVRAIQRKADIICTDYAEIDVDAILDKNLFDFEEARNSAAWLREFDDEANEVDDHDDHDDDDDDDHDHEEHEHHEHGHHHHHHHEHGMDHNDDEGTAEEYGIQTFVYFRRAPFDREKFIDWAQHNTHHIIRSKGILYFSDTLDHGYVYETAGMQIKFSDFGKWYSETHSAQEISKLIRTDASYAKLYDKDYKDHFTKLVFIGQHLKIKEIKAELDAFLVK